jgi:mono/diheme cytochrome c family protein
MAALVVATLVLAGGCAQEKLSPEAERGRQIYQAQCIACHNPDPAQAGAVGPPVMGSSEELLRTKIVSGTYPAGYTPKRPTALMQPMPQLTSEIPNLAAYLR